MDRLRRYLLTVAGPERSPGHNVQLASLLAFSAGVLNSVGFAVVVPLALCLLAAASAPLLADLKGRGAPSR